MPSPEDILRQLTWSASEARWVAAAWHAAVLFAAGALLVRRWRPRVSLAAMLAALPLATASTVAWSGSSPFNGLVLGVTAVALMALGSRLGPTEVLRGPSWTVWVGAAAVVYALLYPHFVATDSWTFLLFAPVGVVPCPSLALTIGLGLLAGGFGSRAWSFTAAGVGLLYAAIGLVRLGVWLDLGLLFAALALLAHAARGLFTGHGLLPPTHGAGAR